MSDYLCIVALETLGKCGNNVSINLFQNSTENKLTIVLIDNPSFCYQANMSDVNFSDVTCCFSPCYVIVKENICVFDI